MAEGEHFRVHQSVDSGKPFIGKPLVARMARQQAMIITRRINKADGAFGGVVAISPHYFARLYATVELGKGSVIGLVGLDGIVRARRAGSNTEIGQDINGTEMMRRIAREPQDNFVARAQMDGVKRVFSYRTLKKYPLSVTVGMAESVAAADAASDAQHAQRTALVVTLLIVLSVGVLLWLTRHQCAVTQALRASELQLRALLDGIPDRVWLKDKDSRFVAVNRAFEAGYQAPMAEIIGTRGLAGIPQYHIPGMLAEDRSVMETRTLLRYERKSVFEDSWQDVIKAPIVAAIDTVIGVVGISRDITERKQLFEQLREVKAAAETASRAKSEFLAAMSHDIRTPMTGVPGMAEMLAETALSSEQQQHLDTMRSSGESMLEIIDPRRNFAKAEAGKMEPRPVAFDAAALVRQSTELFRARAAANGVALRCRIDAPARCRLIGDPALIGRTLTNLVGNAVKFTEHGEVSGGLTITPNAEGHASAQFEVCDTGIGISAADRGRLFRPFTQADRSTTRRFGGTGLGLALSKNMVELLGGDLRVDSTLGKGSRFYFTLDLALAPATTSADTAAASALAQELPSLQGCVLLAEDHPVNRKVLERMLKKYSIEVRHAVDGNGALARWREGGIDLIFMDCHMPDMDGYEATAAIRREERAGNMQHTPIIALTANALVGDARACLEAGMDGYTSKPVRPGRMTRLLMRYLAVQGGGVPARLRRTDVDTVENLANKGLRYGTVERLAQNAPAQLDMLREQLQAGQVAAAVETVANLREATLQTGAPLLTMLLGEFQSATASGGLEDARAALPEREAMLHVTLADLQGAARKVA